MTTSRPLPPDFLLVGAPKCGTTALDYYLRQHPGIFMPAKELHYFGRDLAFPLHGKPDLYFAHFAQAREGQLRGEASVRYLYSREAAREIHALRPDCRILIMLRHPVDAMYSLYNFFQAHGREPLASFEEALEAESDRRQGKRIPITIQRVPDFDLFYRETYRFTEQVKRYFDVFGREQVKVILIEDLHKRPRDVYREALEFLQVDPLFSPDFTPQNVGFWRRIHYPRINRVVRNGLAMKAARWLKEHGRGRVVDVLAGAWSQIAYEYEPVPKLDPALRQRLTRELDGEIQALGELLGRDLLSWRAPVQEQPALRA